jgi:hypothetical protein
VASPADAPLLNNRLDVHDRKQFEIKLEYEPAPGAEAKYLIDTYFFLPASLNITPETYPHEDFYADIHNYVRLKTPVLTLTEILEGPSPLKKMEATALLVPGSPRGKTDETDLVYQAKLLSCVFRGALRRFSKAIDERCVDTSGKPDCGDLEPIVNQTIGRAAEVLLRYRVLGGRLKTVELEERTFASLRLIDEYMSLTLEQFFRKAVAEMERLPRTPTANTLRKALLAEVIRDETYRRTNNLKSVLSPTGDNEEYMHRIGFLKKFCQNILFLKVRRDGSRKQVEEVLFAIAAGIAMIFATSAAFFGMRHWQQISFPFFSLLVVSYMLKDRIKEGGRKFFASLASKHLFDRSTVIFDPVTRARIGKLQEKVDYGGEVVKVPDDIARLRRFDDFITVSQGELSETVIRYQKQIRLEDELFHNTTLSRGVTDIIRFNVDRLLRDMDDPEYAIEYVDSEDLTVGRVKGAKSYQVDVGFRFTATEGDVKRVSFQFIRLVLDRNGIKRMLRSSPAATEPARSAA